MSKTVISVIIAVLGGIATVATAMAELDADS